MNNLQALSLKNLFLNKNDFLISEDIEISKDDLKKLKKGSFLEINSKVIKFNHYSIKENKIIGIAKISAKANYIFINYKKYKRVKKFKDNNGFNLRFNFKLNLEGEFAISKIPLNIFLYLNNKDYAIVNLYFKDKFYIEIKELF